MTICTDQFGNQCQVTAGTLLQEVYECMQPQGEYPYVLALTNNDICDFMAPLPSADEVTIHWISLNSMEGALAYQRTLILLLVRASKELWPNSSLRVLHSLGKALFCELLLDHPTTPREINQLEQHMHSIIERDASISMATASRKDSLTYCRRTGNSIDFGILSDLDIPNVTYYRTGDTFDYYFGPMLPSLTYLKLFDLQHYAPGFLLRYPDILDAPNEFPPYKELPKFAKVFLEAREWGDIMDCRYVTQLNQYIENGEIEEIIDMAEALQDKKCAAVADFIVSQKPKIRLVLIAGPSSAGKTTFTRKLVTQLRINGTHPLMISLDDYFKERHNTPLLPDGSYDFESVNALDVEFFSQQLTELYEGKEVHLPIFDFKTGKRIHRDEVVRHHSESPIIVEGLHALNDDLSRIVPRYEKVKISLGALTQITINDHNRISTSDTRLIRRLVRDHQFRNHDAESTLAMWENVRRGEETNIYPFQEDADVIFNSALIYELAVLKKMAEPLLVAVPNTSPYFHQAHRLLRFLSPFKKLDTTYVPPKSILREFVGKN